jgi:hypothetical protein
MRGLRDDRRPYHADHAAAGGTLAQTATWQRLAACGIALVVYFVFRRNLFIGIAAGFVALIAVILLGR